MDQTTGKLFLEIEYKSNLPLIVFPYPVALCSSQDESNDTRRADIDTFIEGSWDHLPWIDTKSLTQRRS